VALEGYMFQTKKITIERNIEDSKEIV